MPGKRATFDAAAFLRERGWATNGCGGWWYGDDEFVLLACDAVSVERAAQRRRDAHMRRWMRSVERAHARREAKRGRGKDLAVSDLGHCRACGRSVLWVTTINLKKMPVDPDPHAEGNVDISDRGAANVP